ncbi:hypothetical protein ACFFX1_22540, partial [Dactylosporangium sucinum]
MPLHTSRRLPLRRTAVTSVAALAALVAASGLALAGTPGSSGAPATTAAAPSSPATSSPAPPSSAPPPAVVELPRHQGTAPPRFAAGPLANARADIGWSTASQCGTGLVKFAGGTYAYPGRAGTMHVVRTAAGD